MKIQHISQTFQILILAMNMPFPAAKHVLPMKQTRMKQILIYSMII